MGVNRHSRRGFTLIEIMVVIAILGIMLTVAIPPIYRTFHPDSMKRALDNMMDACTHARAYAILNNVTTEVIIRPPERTVRLGTVAAAPTISSGPENTLTSEDVSGREWRMADRGTQNAGGGGDADINFSFSFSPRITLEGIGLNGEDWTEDEEVRVRFYPNGTSDQFSLVLLGEDNQRRNIWLEVVTGLPEFESDPQKFKAR